ncbi:hypothetical protein D3C71_1506990 [compost metagenome]
MARVAPLDTGYHLVTDTDIGKGATHHHFMVTTARAVGVKILRRNAMIAQITSRRAVTLDIPRWRDMVGGHRVGQDRQNARILDILHRIRLHLHGAEEWRMPNIGRIALPLVGGRAGNLNRLPVGVTVKYRAVFLMEHLSANFFHRLGNIFAARPDILQIDRLPVVTFAQRLFGQINLHAASQRISDHQRR